MAEKDPADIRLPKEPIQRLVSPVERFLHVEAAGGIVLLVCTIAALFLANSGFGERYLAFWNTQVVIGFGAFQMDHSLQHWINDGLMAIFFFVIGLEVKRELVLGELRDMKRAALPIAAAVGGMVVPAGLYLALQSGGPGQDGWGIAMATDIAFVVGCMALLGPRVPQGLRILLLSLAIADDIGAILVVAIGYTDSIGFLALVLGFVGIAVIFVFQRLGIRSVGVYTFVGAGIWLAFHESGVHATIAGVILGLQTPARSWLSETQLADAFQKAGAFLHGEGRMSRVTVGRVQTAAREAVSPVERLENLLHPWVSFGIMPIFALANAGVVFELSDFGNPVAIAIMVGLCVGKPLGILLFSWTAVRTKIAQLPEGVGWGALTAGGVLAGIGFTMALFIAGLALERDSLDAAKVGILGASALCAVVGMTALVMLLPKKP